MTFSPRFNFAAKTVAITLAAVLAASCKKEIPEDAIVSVGNAHLTMSRLSAAIPDGLSEVDSTAFAESYISTWISDQLITEVAVKHLPNTREIDTLAEEYRRNLIMWEYLRLKTAQDPSLAATKDSVSAYYRTHGSEFITTEPMIRGVYVRIPSDSPRLSDVKRLYRSKKAEDMDRLEKLSMRDHDITFDYFQDKWVSMSQIRAAMPVGTEINLKPDVNFENEATGLSHFLHITDVLPIGSEMPEEVATPLIIRRLEAQNRAEIERQLRNDLFKQAMADGKIRSYD